MALFYSTPGTLSQAARVNNGVWGKVWGGFPAWEWGGGLVLGGVGKVWGYLLGPLHAERAI